MGTKESLKRGSIQFMTAGKGINHSEANNGDKPLRFIQTWILPRARGLTPEYGSSCPVDFTTGKNKLQHLVSDVDNKEVNTPVKISQDADAYAAELEMGEKIVHNLPEGRQAYLLCLEGEVTINGNKLSRHDASEIVGAGPLEIEATSVEDTENGKLAHILMFTMKEVPGSGRKDL